MMFGVGPGQLASDAAMLGINVDDQRRMMEESFDVIMALFRGEIGHGQDRLVHDRRGPAAAAAVLELRHRRRRLDLAIGPQARRPPRRRAAVGGGDQPGRLREPGRPLEGHGGAGAPRPAAPSTARSWRMMGPMHIAETEEQALDDCRYGLERVMDYLAHVDPDAADRGDRTTRAGSRR